MGNSPGYDLEHVSMCQLCAQLGKSKYFHLWEMYKRWQDEWCALAAQSGASVTAQCASCTSSGLFEPGGFSGSRWNMRVQSQDLCRGCKFRELLHNSCMLRMLHNLAVAMPMNRKKEAVDSCRNTKATRELVSQELL